MALLEPVSVDQIKTEIHRIELEDDLPLYVNDVEKARSVINDLIASTHFDTVGSVDDIPETKKDLMKPDNNLLVYGLGDGEWTLSIRLDDAVDDILVCTINCLAGRFLRCRDIYALRYNVEDNKIDYTFRTGRPTSKSDLDERWHDVRGNFVGNDLSQILNSLDVPSDSAAAYKEAVRSLKTLITPVQATSYLA